MGNERYNAPAPHERTLPHVPVSEQGLRELEIWLLARLRKLLLQQVRSPGSGWRFNVYNGQTTEPAAERGFGYVQTTACFDIDLVEDPTATGGDWGMALVDSSGCGILIGSDGSVVQIKARQGDVVILADGGFVALSTNGGDVIVNLEQSGDTHVVNDHLGSPIVTWTG